MTPTTGYRLLQVALAFFGTVMLLLYPLAVVWPSGWAWHHGAPYESDYFMMIVGLYATLGLFLWNAARQPANNISLIWFTVWSSVCTPWSWPWTFQHFCSRPWCRRPWSAQRASRGPQAACRTNRRDLN